MYKKSELELWMPLDTMFTCLLTVNPFYYRHKGFLKDCPNGLLTEQVSSFY